MRASLMVVSVLSFAASIAAAQEPVVVRLGTVAPAGTPWEAHMKRVGQNVEKATAGKTKFKSFLGGAKGDEKSLVRQCREARLEACGVSMAALATEVPDLDVLELPYLFESSEEADFVFDNHLRKPIAELAAKNGFVFYQYAENGWQNFATKSGFIKTPADLKGKKFRSQETPVHIAMWKGFGAAPVEMSVSEVLPALQTGLVEGFAQTPLFTFATGWHQGIKFYTLSRHIYQPAIVVYSKKWFDGLAADLQKQLLVEIEATEKFARQGVRGIEPGLLQNFVNYGIQVHTPTADERAQFVKLAKKVQDDYAKRASKASKELLAKIREGKAAFAAQAKK